MAVQEEFGQEKLAELYTALGSEDTERRDKLDRELITEALVSVGVPAALADAMDDESFDDAIKKSHHERDGPGGRRRRHADHRHRRQPSSARCSPRSPAARTPERSGTAAVALSSFPYFAELKRTRRTGLDFC